MRFSFSAFVFHVFVVGTTTLPKSIGSTTTRKMSKNNHQQEKATAPHTPTPPVRYLVAQPGKDCSISGQPATLTYVIRGSVAESLAATNPTQSDDERYYTLRATVSTATIAFAERPARSAITVKTEDFVKEFDDALFVTSKPNGAITFTGTTAPTDNNNNNNEETNLTAALPVNQLFQRTDFGNTEPTMAPSSNNTGPLIVVLTEPKIVGTNPDDSTVVVEYTIRQSESQRAVVSIEQFMDDTFRSCSLFIDGIDIALLKNEIS